jgi:Flp pilus assembly protein TadG
VAPHRSDRRQRRQSGNAMIEMTMIGIPIIFVLISIFEMARGMWIYHSLSHAVKEGTRYASVHGINCTTAPNNCGLFVSNIAAKIRDEAVGLESSRLQVRLCVNCGANAAGMTDDTGLQTIDTLLSRTTVRWPDPTGTGKLLHNRITFTAQYPFDSALAMLAPMGGGQVRFGRFIFVATAAETIHF